MPLSSIPTSVVCKPNEAHIMDPKKTDIIPTLAKENGWLSDDKHPLFCYQGFWYHEFFARGVIAAQCDSYSASLNPSRSDTIICSPPKTGTTWLMALTFSISTRTKFPNDKHLESGHPLHFTHPHDLIPLMETDIMLGRKPRNPDVPLLSTHLPYTNLPGSIMASGCKIVYIWRDPKNAFVSCWHFAHKVRPNKDVTKPIPLEEAFDLFCRGISPSGPYWDHVLGYWKENLACPGKILFLKYEDMMNDVEGHVKRLAEFMGYPFSDEEEKGGVVKRIVEMCSFESLSKLEVNKGGAITPNAVVPVTKDAFFRKAKVGDWSNYLTKEMASKIDKITVDKLGASGLSL